MVFTGVFNFRDLGGLPTHDGRKVRSGQLYRSDSLHRLSGTEAEALAALGIRTILDLRRPHEIERDGRVPDHPQFAYHNPHPHHREWDVESVVPAGGEARFLADRYLEIAVDGVDGVRNSLALIADPERAPLLMHCFAGKDRTGVLTALTLDLLGVPDAEIAADYALSAQGEAPLTRLLREQYGDRVFTPPRHFVLCPPEAILLFLDDLRTRFGSVRGYAATIGVSQAQLAALGGHLLA